MLTKKDIQIIQEIISQSNESLEKRLNNKIAEFKDTIIGRLDNIDQELAITNGYGDHLENHEARITKLEEKQPVTV